MKTDNDIVANVAYTLAKQAKKHGKGKAYTFLDLAQIAQNRHCGNGFYSWDGMHDDLTELFGEPDIATEILSHC
jgi:hypothetical protein